MLRMASSPEHARLAGLVAQLAGREPPGAAVMAALGDAAVVRDGQVMPAGSPFAAAMACQRVERLLNELGGHL